MTKETIVEAWVADLYLTDKILDSKVRHRPVVHGGAGGAMVAPLFFGRSGNPISTKGGILCPPNNTGTPGFSDFPTALRIRFVE